MEEIESDTDSVFTKFEESEGKSTEANKDSDVIIIEKVNKEKTESGGPQIRLYKRRFLIMGIFCLYSMSSAFQWIEYAIITNIVIYYYDGVTMLAITWTSMIYMLSYIPLMFVATWMLDNWGLRRILLFGATLNALGALIKIGSVAPHLFAVSFLGQTIAACAQAFILEIPPKIASLWFGPSELSTATSVGVFGNQLGVALGFLIPPIIVPSSEDKEEVAHGLRVLFISSAVVCAIVVFLIFLVIRDAPPSPPSKARLLSTIEESKNQEKHSSINNYKRSLKVLMKNVPFLLLLVTYGINTGTYYAISTLLNPILSSYHEDAEKQIGEIGLAMVVAGLVGSVACGFFLDRTRLYKITTVGIYVLSLIFMIVFTFTLQLPWLWVDYLSIGVLGFFMTGYLPIGFEFAAEITYPESEATSAGFLNVSAQVFGILFTLSAQEILTAHGCLPANLFLSAALLCGAIGTVLIKENLKRQAAEKEFFNKQMKEAFPNCPLMSSSAENQNNNAAIESGRLREDQEKLVLLTSSSSCNG